MDKEAVNIMSSGTKSHEEERVKQDDGKRVKKGGNFRESHQERALLGLRLGQSLNAIREGLSWG